MPSTAAAIGPELGCPRLPCGRRRERDVVPAPPEGASEPQHRADVAFAGGGAEEDAHRLIISDGKSSGARIVWKSDGDVP
jgi:hypothetical protein